VLALSILLAALCIIAKAITPGKAVHQ